LRCAFAPKRTGADVPSASPVTTTGATYKSPLYHRNQHIMKPKLSLPPRPSISTRRLWTTSGAGVPPVTGGVSPPVFAGLRNLQGRHALETGGTPVLLFCRQCPTSTLPALCSSLLSVAYGLLIIGHWFSASALPADSSGDATNSALPSATNASGNGDYFLSDRDGNQKVWSKVTWETNETGEITAKTNSSY